MAEGTLRIRVVGDASGFQRTMSRTASRLQRVGGRMRDVGATASRRLSLPIAAAGAAVLTTAANFESSMNRVRAVSGATGDDFQRLEGLARELGSTTQFSAGQAADAMGFLAQAGFETEDMMSALPGTLDLAAAGQLELAQAADIASNVLTAFGMEASEIGRVNDTLAATASSANTNVEQMGEAFALVAPVAASSGMAIEETSAVLGVLGDAGIQASRAGTTMRGMLAALESPSTKAASAIEDLGLRTHDAEGALLPMADIVEQLEETGLSTANAMTIFGRRAGPGMAALVKEGSDRLRTLTGELEESGGTAERIADIQMEGLTGAIARFKSALEGAAIAIAESGLIDWAAGLAEKLAGLFQGLSETNPAVLRAGVVVAGLAAAAGPLVAVLGLMVSGIGALLSPVGAVVAALGALAGVITTAYVKSETFREVVNGAFQSVRAVIGPIIGWLGGRFSAMVGWVGDFAQALAGDFGSSSQEFQSLSVSARSTAETIRTFFRTKVMPVFRALAAWWEENGPAITTRVIEVKDTVVAFGRDVQAWWNNNVSPALAAFKQAVDDNWPKIKEAGEDLQDMFRALGRLASTIIGSAMPEDIGKGTAKSEEDFGGMGDSVGQLADDVKTAMGAIETAANGMESTWNLVMGGVTGDFEQMHQGIDDVTEGRFSGTMEKIKGAVESVDEFVADRVDDIVGWFRDLPGRIGDALGNLGQKIKDKFSFDLPGINFAGSGDGPGGFMGPGSGGGPAAARAAQASAGLPIVKTSGYRTPAQNRAAGGSPTSWHLDRSDPATDWAGPTWALDQFAARLRQMGGWRELLWRVPNHAPGDNPHVHVAHSGGTVTNRGIEPLRFDELLTKVQTGETIIPRGGEGAMHPVQRPQPVVINIDGREVARATIAHTRDQAARLQRQGEWL